MKTEKQKFPLEEVKKADNEVLIRNGQCEYFAWDNMLGVYRCKKIASLEKEKKHLQELIDRFAKEHAEETRELANKHENEIERHIQGHRANAEKIKTLEKENAYLKENLHARDEYNQTLRLEKEKLEKENAELKKISMHLKHTECLLYAEENEKLKKEVEKMGIKERAEFIFNVNYKQFMERNAQIADEIEKLAKKKVIYEGTKFGRRYIKTELRALAKRLRK